MKTPREILLQRHEADVPKLDAIRESTVAAVCDRRTSTDRAHEQRSPTAATRIWQIIWHELIWSSRRIWTGLAAVWLIILAANFSMRDHSQTAAERSAAPTVDMILVWQEQERLLAELIGPNATPAAKTPKRFLTQPRGERHLNILVT